MANIILVQLLILIFCSSLFAKDADRIHLESYLGQKDIEEYSERYQPLIIQDPYLGRMTFEDDSFFKNYFSPYLFQKESEYEKFFRSELNVGSSCTNEMLAGHFDDIRYAYRLITLSYLLENEWHMKLMSDALKLKGGCEFDLKSWIKSCKPRSAEMKSFLSKLEKFQPRYEETIPASYTKSDWVKEINSHQTKWQSQYRLKPECKGKCSENDLPKYFKASCEKDQTLMNLICSEDDELYGLSQNRQAYYLIGLSNIINTMNKKGEALNCLRRFSEVMSHKEAHYPSLDNLFPFLESFLRQKYQERFLQGRAFFYGSGKEFETKGLSELYVKEQPLKIEKLPPSPAEPKEEKPPVVKPEVPAVVTVAKVEPKKETEMAPVKEIKVVPKSAFLLAAELRKNANLEQVEVDMLKLKYDYIFSLNMVNTLSERLKTFMTRDAILEMMTYDKLGTKEGPVPLLFLKFMIDMEEHHGLWNLVTVLGNKFYVSNEIDPTYSPEPELIQLMNNQETGNQWRLYILRP